MDPKDGKGPPGRVGGPEGWSGEPLLLGAEAPPLSSTQTAAFRATGAGSWWLEDQGQSIGCMGDGPRAERSSQVGSRGLSGKGQFSDRGEQIQGEET